jgi:peroxiredoxin Q/BCP
LQKELPYPLLSDRKRVLISALGAGDGGKTKRSHFIFEKGGKLIDKKIPVKAADRLVLVFLVVLTRC